MRLAPAAALLTLVPALAFAGAGNRSAGTQDFSRTETVRPGQRLEVDLESGGGVVIHAWDRNEVRVVCHRDIEDCPDADVEVNATERGVEVTSDYRPDTGNSHSCSMTIEVMVPRRFDVHLESSGGSIEIEGVSGEIEGTTGGGSLELRQLKGRVDLRTGGGSIEVTDSDLDGRVSTGGGDVRFENVTGTVRGTSGSLRRPVTARSRRG